MSVYVLQEPMWGECRRGVEVEILERGEVKIVVIEEDHAGRGDWQERGQVNLSRRELLAAFNQEES